MSRSIIQQHTLGYSVQMRPIIAYEAYSHQKGPSGPISLLIIGAFHGDEPISTALLDRLLSCTALPPGVLVIPSFNPDGLAAGIRVNANGVDLNRNYPTQNWIQQEEGTPYYSGPAPVSEPETRLLISLIGDRPPAAILSVHSPYKVVNYDGPARHLAEGLSQALGYPVVDSIGYPTPGSFGTWAGIEQNIPTLTLELPENEPFEHVWRDNEPGFQYLFSSLDWTPF